MNVLKKFILALSIGIFSFSYAQKIDAKAKALLDAVATNYKTKNIIYFKFNYAMGSGKSAQNYTGDFYASKNKYRFDAMGNIQIFDGNKVYNINREDQEITISKPNSGDQLLSPISYLEAYKKGYNIARAGKKNNQEIVKLTPTKNNGIKEVLLYINSTKKQIEKIEQVANDNSKTTISITQYKENPKVEASAFSFNKNLYKNYLITEL